jgi:hypothetical protein
VRNSGLIQGTDGFVTVCVRQGGNHGCASWSRRKTTSELSS